MSPGSAVKPALPLAKLKLLHFHKHDNTLSKVLQTENVVCKATGKIKFSPIFFHRLQIFLFQQIV